MGIDSDIGLRTMQAEPVDGLLETGMTNLGPRIRSVSCLYGQQVLRYAENW